MDLEVHRGAREHKVRGAGQHGAVEIVVICKRLQLQGQVRDHLMQLLMVWQGVGHKFGVLLPERCVPPPPCMAHRGLLFRFPAHERRVPVCVNVNVSIIQQCTVQDPRLCTGSIQCV